MWEQEDHNESGKAMVKLVVYEDVTALPSSGMAVL